MLKLKTALKRQKATAARLRVETDGNISLLSAVSLSALLLGGTVAIDLTSTFKFKADMQVALDTAVLAAASNADEDFWVIGQTTYELNISEGPLAGTKVNFEKKNTNDLDEMVGTASGSLPLLFSGLLKKPSMDITVRSVTNVKIPSSLPCITASSQSGTPVDVSSTMYTTECEKHVPTETAIVVNSNSNIKTGLSVK